MMLAEIVHVFALFNFKKLSKGNLLFHLFLYNWRQQTNFEETF